MALQVDILYTEDCTDWQATAEIVQRALADLELEGEINYWLVASDQQALEWFFIGSPSIRVNGYELFPVDGATAGKRLRSYETEEGVLGHPTYQMVISALRAFADPTRQ